MGKKLLIVDDHQGMARSIRMVGESIGFECKMAHNSDDGLSVFLTFQPDVVMVDMMMPEKDGLDLLTDILKTDIPSRFILTSGYGDGFLRLGERAVGLARGEKVKFLRKPFRREQLVALLNEA